VWHGCSVAKTTVPASHVLEFGRRSLVANPTRVVLANRHTDYRSSGILPISSGRQVRRDERRNLMPYPNVPGDDDVQGPASQGEQADKAAPESEDVQGNVYRWGYTDDAAGGDAKSEAAGEGDVEGHWFRMGVNEDASSSDSKSESAGEGDVEGHWFRMGVNDDASISDPKSEDSGEDDAEGHRLRS
jgi:hypothetical protein